MQRSLAIIQSCFVLAGQREWRRNEVETNNFTDTVEKSTNEGLWLYEED